MCYNGASSKLDNFNGGGTVKDWLKRVIRKVGGTEVMILLAGGIATLLAITLRVVLPPVYTFSYSGLIILYGWAFTYMGLIVCSPITARPLVRWAHSDDDKGTLPPDQKLLMQNAFQEIEDYISGKSLIEEIERLRTRFVAHLRPLFSFPTPSLRAT